MKILEFGDPLLRQKARLVTAREVKTDKFQTLINNMYQLLSDKKLGVGLAAPQIGRDLSLAIVLIQPTKHRAKVKLFELTIINPKIVKTYGNRAQMWEGCISGGPGKSSLFAKVPRYKKIELSFIDKNGETQTDIFEGLAAHVIQHEIDHLNGILFVDKVKDTKTFVTYSQYLKTVKVKNVK